MRVPKDSRLRRVDPGLKGLAGPSALPPAPALALLLSFFLALPRAGGEGGSGTTSLIVSLGALAWVGAWARVWAKVWAKVWVGLGGVWALRGSDAAVRRGAVRCGGGAARRGAVRRGAVHRAERC